MRGRYLTPLVVLVLIVTLALAVAVAGCGGDSSGNAAPEETATTAAVSADQIVKDSEAKMAAVESASFVADMGLTIQGDASQMSDPTAQAMLADGVTLHAEGASSNQPTAVDMKMNVSLGGQNLAFGMMSQGDESWIEYQGTWYALDKKNAKTLDEQAQTGAAPTEQLKSLGIDPTTWGTSYELVDTTELNGVKVYHVKASADPQKLANSLMKAVEDPTLMKKLGGGSGDLAQIEQALKENKKQAKELGKSLMNVSVDYWIGVDDMLMYKAQFSAALDTKGQKDMEGVEGMGLKATVSMSKFNEPVSVTPPKKAKSFDELMQQMFGAMMGSGSGGSTSL